MARTPVRSSNLRSVGYDAAKRVLEVEFTSGRVYRYAGVPEAVYRGLMGAESHGGFFARHIRSSYAGTHAPPTVDRPVE